MTAHTTPTTEVHDLHMPAWGRGVAVEDRRLWSTATGARCLAQTGFEALLEPEVCKQQGQLILPAYLCTLAQLQQA